MSGGGRAGRRVGWSHPERSRSPQTGPALRAESCRQLDLLGQARSRTGQHRSYVRGGKEEETAGGRQHGRRREGKEEREDETAKAGSVSQRAGQGCSWRSQRTAENLRGRRRAARRKPRGNNQPISGNRNKRKTKKMTMRCKKF